jgi:hypothetical protein
LAAYSVESGSGLGIAPGADPIDRHIASCPRCAAELNAWRQTERALRRLVSSAVAPASTCPDENELAEYFDGVAGFSGRNRIERHLADCARCLERIADLHELCAALEPPNPRFAFAARWIENGLTWIQESLRGVQPVALVPVPVLRSPHDSQRALACTVNHEGYRIRVTVQHGDDGRVSCVFHWEHAQGGAHKSAILLSRGGMLLESRTHRDQDTFAFHDLGPGDYEARMEFPDTAVDLAFTITR